MRVGFQSPMTCSKKEVDKSHIRNEKKSTLHGNFFHLHKPLHGLLIKNEMKSQLF